MTTLRFHGSAAVLLLPLALFVAVTARLFISEAAFDLTGLAAAGVLTLFSGSLLAKSPSEYWKAAVRGASSELTGWSSSEECCTSRATPSRSSCS